MTPAHQQRSIRALVRADPLALSASTGFRYARDMTELSSSEPHAFTQWLGRLILSITGWKVEGAKPSITQSVIIAAPHTSNWDFFYLLAGAKPKGENSLARQSEPLLGTHGTYHAKTWRDSRRSLEVKPIGEPVSHSVHPIF